MRKIKQLKQAIHDEEMRLEQNRLQVNLQTQQLQARLLEQLRTPHILLGGLGVGVLLGLLGRKRRDSGAATGKKSRRHQWRRTLKTFARYAPVVSAAARNFNAELQKRKKNATASEPE